MKPGPVSSVAPPQGPGIATPLQPAEAGRKFDALLAQAQSGYSPIAADSPQSPRNVAEGPLPGPPVLSAPRASGPSAPRQNLPAAYRNGNAAPAPPPSMSGLQKYRDDQLLRNPGGRNYYLDTKTVTNKPGKQPVWNLIKKDIADFFGNVRNFVGNMLMGTTVLHRDEKGEIIEGHQKGLLRTAKDFLKDLGGALTFGAWHPDRTDAPRGFKARMLYFSSKLKDAFLGDIVGGVPLSVNHMARNIILSGWHLAEVAPDAVIGAIAPGQKLTTTVFDNGHVMIEYLTDVIPSGDAWLRVHASNLKDFKLPVLYNLKMPEHLGSDTRWENVRNTKFRKTIETIGALLSDACAVAFIGQTGGSSNRRHEIDY